MLLVCNLHSYQKISSDIFFFILDSYHLDILYLREQGCEDPCLFFEAKRGSRAEKFGENTRRVVRCGCVRPLTVFLFRTGHRPERKCPKAHTHCRQTYFVARVDRSLSCSSGAIGLRKALCISFPYSVPTFSAGKNVKNVPL